MPCENRERDSELLEKEDEGLSLAGCANAGRPSSARQGAKAGEEHEGQREGVQPWNGHSEARVRQRLCAGEQGEARPGKREPQNSLKPRGAHSGTERILSAGRGGSETAARASVFTAEWMVKVRICLWVEL